LSSGPAVYSFFFFFPSSIVFPRLFPAVADWMFTMLSTHGVSLSANLGCRSETCCMRLAENTGRKNGKNSPSRHHHTTLSGYIFATKAQINNARIDNRKKNLVREEYLPQCRHNMVNFGPPAAEIGSLVWGTTANFNEFRVLASLLHGTLVVSVSQTLLR